MQFSYVLYKQQHPSIAWQKLLPGKTMRESRNMFSFITLCSVNTAGIKGRFSLNYAAAAASVEANGSEKR